MRKCPEEPWTHPELVGAVGQLVVGVLPGPVDHWAGVARSVTPQRHVLTDTGLQLRRTRLGLDLRLYKDKQTRGQISHWRHGRVLYSLV